nr:hypothetical protein [Candidatus Njordarchaeum guaymaensis]
MKRTSYGGHIIEVRVSILTGKKRIFYDGKEVYAKRSVAASVHVFQVKEGGEDAKYEVQAGSRWHRLSAWVRIRRNGEIIYTDI